MLGGLFRRLVGGGRSGGGDAEITATEEYQSFELQAAPRKDPNGWRVAGRVVQEHGGETRAHDFVRADTYPGRDDATHVSLRKARQIVDEQGEHLFD